MNTPVTQSPTIDERVLVLTPSGRDGPLTCAILAGRAGVHCEECRDLHELCAKIAEGAGAAVLAEEALDPSSARRLIDTLSGQLPWSDLPLLIITGRGEVTTNGVPISVIRQRGNVT